MKLKEQTVINEFKKTLLKKLRNNIVLMKLFGSQIRGDATPDSDIDILIVYRGNTEISKKIIDTEWEIIKKFDYNYPLSVILYNIKEYKHDVKLQTPFIYNILNEGIDLWNMPHKKMS